jgi:hypothetical protein
MSTTKQLQSHFSSSSSHELSLAFFSQTQPLGYQQQLVV